jgi:hypothetical protein
MVDHVAYFNPATEAKLRESEVTRAVGEAQALSTFQDR